MISKKLALVTTAAVALSSLLTMSTPASAVGPQRSLPAADHLYALPSDRIESPILRSVETSDSSWTDVGVAHAFDNVREVTGAAYDPITHDSYFIGNSDGDWYDLIRVSTTDGTMTKIGQFPGNLYPPGLLITNTGQAYLQGGASLFPLNLSDASYGQQIGSDASIGDAGVGIKAGACSPVAPTCYVIGQVDEGHNSVFATFDVATGAVGAPLGTLPVSNTFSMKVDSQGTIWVTTNDGHLASFDPTNPAGSYVEGPLFPSGAPTYPHLVPALLLTTTAQTPAPSSNPGQSTLPNTGADRSGFIAGAALLLAVGALVLVYVRRKKNGHV